MLWLKLVSPIFLLLSILAQYGVNYIWHDKRMKWHRRIRVVLLIFQIAAGLLTIVVVASDFKTVEEQNATLKQIADQSKVNEIASAQRDKLNQEELGRLRDQVAALSDRLSPFIQLATNRYPNLPEDTALDRLAKEIADIRKLAEPNKLVAVSHDVKKIDSGYLVTLNFRSTKNEQLSVAIVSATLIQKSQERILDIRPSRAQGVFIGFGDKTKQISEDGRSARLSYKPLAPHPAVEIEVSGPTRIMIQVIPGISPFEIDIM